MPKSNFLDILLPIKEERESLIKLEQYTLDGTSIIKGESGSLQTEFTNSDSLFADNKYRVNRTKGLTHFSMSKFSF